MSAKKSPKSQRPKPASAETQLNLIALKPLKKTPETQKETGHEGLESLAPELEPTRVAKPIKKAPAPAQPLPEEQSDNEPTESSQGIFQAIGVIVGEVNFSDNKAQIAIAEKQYPLHYASSHKRAYQALQLHIKRTGQSQQRLIVYPRVMHFPKKEQLYRIGFQLVGFDTTDASTQQESTTGDSVSIDKQLQDFEFKLSGLWQFIPVCQTPCITIQKNFNEQRLAYIKEAAVEERVKFMKASHIPVLWREAPVRPFRFNPRLDKQQQGQVYFVEIKATFLPAQDVFRFCELRSPPSKTAPKFLKVGKFDKAQALKINRKGFTTNG